MAFISFPYHRPIAYQHLPLTLMTLDDWAVINVSGPDSQKYLQSQTTANIVQMNTHQHLLTAHCNPKGKMWSNLLIFRRGKGFTFIERRSLRDIQLIELKKYAIFSKVNFTIDDDSVLLGIAGCHARTSLTYLFHELPTEKKQVVNTESTTLLWFKYPTENFLIVTNIKTAEHITDALQGKAQFNNSQQWLAINIEAGIPIIDTPNSGLFMPQTTNLQILGGIDLKKGCYIGQEAIIRSIFRGKNKLAMWNVLGNANRVPTIGEQLEIKIENTWRRTGTVLAAVRLKDTRVLIQVIMNKDLKQNNLFRVQDDCNVLHIQPLPYTKR